MHAVGLSFTLHLGLLIKSSFSLFNVPSAGKLYYRILQILSKTLLVSVDDEILLFKL
jgi:hypothetical protein